MVVMVSAQDRQAIIDLARRYDVGRILLFGSSADPKKEAHDIDLAVEDIAPAGFFYFYGDLIFSLSKPVDLVDLSKDTKFNRLIQQNGVPLYDRNR